MPIKNGLASLFAFTFKNVGSSGTLLEPVVTTLITFEYPEISVSVQKEIKNYILMICDNGPGIPKEDLPFIFDKFYRVSRKNNEEIEGFGIGLAYVKKICDLHHWKISAVNSGTGLCIEIKIPLKYLSNE